MVFTPAPWYHLRPERAPGTLLVLLFDKLKPGKQKVPVHNYTRFTALRAVSHSDPINYPFGMVCKLCLSLFQPAPGPSAI